VVHLPLFLPLQPELNFKTSNIHHITQITQTEKGYMMAMAIPSIEEIKAMLAEEIQKLTTIKCLMTCFGQGASGRQVETSEMKNLTKEERDELANECRADLLTVASV